MKEREETVILGSSERVEEGRKIKGKGERNMKGRIGSYGNEERTR